jgi:hypothetical protein
MRDDAASRPDLAAMLAACRQTSARSEALVSHARSRQMRRSLDNTRLQAALIRQESRYLLRQPR